MFNSQKEIWKHLSDGGAVYNGSYIYKFSPETGFLIKASNSKARAWLETTESFKRFSEYKNADIKEEPKKEEPKLIPKPAEIIKHPKYQNRLDSVSFLVINKTNNQICGAPHSVFGSSIAIARVSPLSIISYTSGVLSCEDKDIMFKRSNGFQANPLYIEHHEEVTLCSYWSESLIGRKIDVFMKPADMKSSYGRHILNQQEKEAVSQFHGNSRDIFGEEELDDSDY